MDKVVELVGGGSVMNRAYPVWFFVTVPLIRSDTGV